MSEIIQQVSPQRIRDDQIMECNRKIFDPRRSIVNCMTSIRNADFVGGMIENTATQQYERLRQGMLNQETSLMQTLNLTTDTIYGFKNLAYDDRYGTQVYTELYLASIRRWVLGLMEAAKFLRAGTVNPRVYSKYTQLEIQPEGQCLALKAAVSLWLAEERVRYDLGRHPVGRDIGDVKLLPEDLYLDRIAQCFFNVAEELMRTYDVLMEVFELIWPGVGMRGQQLFPD